VAKYEDADRLAEKMFAEGCSVDSILSTMVALEDVRGHDYLESEQTAHEEQETSRPPRALPDTARPSAA